MKDGHTLGPWSVAFTGDFDKELNGQPAVIIGHGLRIHVDTREFWRDPRPDAHLVAAAPVLLQSLQALVTALRGLSRYPAASVARKSAMSTIRRNLVEQAEQALRLAQGEK